MKGVPCEQCRATSASADAWSKEAEKQQCRSLLPTSVLCAGFANDWNQQPTVFWLFETYFSGEEEPFIAGKSVVSDNPYHRCNYILLVQ